MRLHWDRRQLIGCGAMAAGGLLLAVAAFGPAVRWRVASEGARRHCVVQVGKVRPAWGGVRLLDVSVVPQGTDSVRLHADDMKICLSVGFHVRKVVVRGGELDLDGSPEHIREDVQRWRAARGAPKESGSGQGASVYASGVAVRWKDPELGGGVDVRGISASRDPSGTRLTMADGQARLGSLSAEWSDASIDLDPLGSVARARALAVTVGWVGQPDTAVRDSPAPPPSGPALSPPALARQAVVHAGRSTHRPRPAAPPADAGAPLVSLPDLHAVRRRAAVLASAFADHFRPGADVRVASVTWRVTQDSARVALTVGPGPFSVERTPSSLALAYTTEAHAAGTPLTVRLALPTGDGDVVATVEGGPVSLALLGVKEHAAGLVDVDRAMLSGKARIALAGDGSALTFDADGSVHGLSIDHPKLALETVRGLDLALRARGELTADGDIRLDDVGTALGALRIAGGGGLEQRSDHVAGTGRFEVPVTPCQSLLESVPAALLPALQGTKMVGTFGARGHFAFDTRSLDDLELKYDIQDRCRVVDVPPALAHDRFQGPFSHRIYLPDGTTTDDVTGPGTLSWTPLDEISPYMQTAVFTTEDGAFPKHHGYNHAAIRASIIANLKARRFVRGASTITMQLAKNLFLSRDKTLSRKLEEVVLTDYLEQTFSKDEILELYFNVIEFGPAIYGIGAAAEYYFGRSPAELDLAECLFLSSILPAPLRYATMREGDQPPEGWMRTLHMLMEIAHKRGLITDAELAEGENEPVTFWHGGPRPTPRPPARSHASSGQTGDSDVADPFESPPE